MGFDPFAPLAAMLNPIDAVKNVTRSIFSTAQGIVNSRKKPDRPRKAPKAAVAAKKAEAHTVLKPLAEKPVIRIPEAATRFRDGPAFVTSIVEPMLTPVYHGISHLAGVVSGMNKRISEMDEELDSFHEVSDAHILSVVRDYSGPLLLALTSASVSAMAALAISLVESDPDLPSSTKATLSTAFKSATTLPDLQKVIMEWRTASSSMWNRFVASAPQTVGGAVLTLVKDSAWISGSPDIKLQAAVTAMVALFVGNEKLTWLAAGVIPAIKFARSYLGVPITTSTALSAPTAIANVAGLNPLGVARNSLKFTTTLKGAPQLMRTDMDATFTIEAAELVSPIGTFALSAPSEAYRPIDLDAGKAVDLVLTDRLSYTTPLGGAYSTTFEGSFLRVTLKPSLSSASNGSYEPSVAVSPRFSTAIPAIVAPVGP